MSFHDFAMKNGLIIRHIRVGCISRCRTIDHPNKLNGAYFFDGENGWVQNWANQSEIFWYKNGSPGRSTENISGPRERDQRFDGYAIAAKKAEKTLSQCVVGKSNYLLSKGFFDEPALLLNNNLIIPMDHVKSGRIVGYQKISEIGNGHFEKRFLHGMRAKNAVHVIGRGNLSVLCEGYATGISLSKAASLLKLNLQIVVCFSAGNIKSVSKFIGNAIAADHDGSGVGERAAIDSGLPYMMPDAVGMDWNDVHQRDGLFAVSGKLGELVRKN